MNPPRIPQGRGRAADSGTPPILEIVSDAAKPTGKTTIQSVSRASRLLLAVAASPDGLSAKAASEHFGLSMPTTYHLLTTLAAEGLLVKDARRHYMLGPRAAVIAAAVSRDNRAPEYYLQPLRDLAAATGETAYLSAWRNGSIAVLQTVEGAHAVRVAGLTAGYGDNVHARASGKLLLAFASPADRERTLSVKPLRALTTNTITDRSLLEKEFEKIRRERISFDHGEFFEGVDCVSAPITEDGFVVACYAVSVPSARWATEQEQIVNEVQRAAEKVSNLRILE
jgi:DNA-binding IclR family transcriptional regulator